MEIQLSNLSFSYGQDSAKPTLRHISLDVKPGETVAIIGRSGSGKSTLLRMINGLLTPQKGCVRLNQTVPAPSEWFGLRRRMGYVMQEAGLFPHLPVEENMTLMARIDRWPSARIQNRLRNVLSLVHLDGTAFRRRSPRLLSGGERQRAAIARALFFDPSVLLMDEPFAHLDTLTRKELLNEFSEIVKKLRKTIILVTHDLSVASRLAKRIILISEGVIETDTDIRSFITSPSSPLAKEFVSTIVSAESSG